MADTDYIQRSEYDRRHQELSDQFMAQVQRLDIRIDKAELSDTSLKTQIETKFEKVTDKIDASERLLSTQITTLKDDIYRTRTTDLWRVIGWGVSFVLGGGGTVGLLQALHLLR